MKKHLLGIIFLSLLTSALFMQSCNFNDGEPNGKAEQETDEYDSPHERDLQEFEKIKDPALGYVPNERLFEAMKYTELMKANPDARTLVLNWTERGPNYDSVGPSNGNLRGTNVSGSNPPGTYTAGRIRAVFMDPTDATNNTVFIGSVAGGLWRTSNFLSASPTWLNVDDFFDNLSISSICMDPSNTNIMYFSTGEPSANADAVLGKGVWKSTNHGNTWALLPSTAAFTRGFKILCDIEGKVYLARRGGGIYRSADGGTSWVDITPSGILNTTSVTDIELSSTGVMHISAGFYTSGTSVATIRYTNAPGTVTAAGWNTPSGLPTTAFRIEIATLGDVVYLAPTNTSNNVYGVYLSTDGGQNYRAKQAATYPTGLTNTQGWYNISLEINPADPAQIIVGGLDAYRSSDSGANVQRMTYWVTTAPYVHADHHYVKWWQVAGQDRILMATDGGLFYSSNNGANFADKNKGLAIKQFYSVAVHPTNPNYFLAGAQDNGVHQLKYEGIGPSTEVTGGDGCLVHINQLNPNIQFGSYVYNQYRRSTNGGATWSSVNISNSLGMFVNPWTYDDAKNILYACYGATTGVIRRWPNANTATTTTSLNLTSFTGGVSALTVSPYTANRVYIGGTTGRLIRIDNADTLTDSYMAANTTNISGNLPTNAYLNCIAVGTDDDNLLAIFTNYGVSNVWYTNDGGTNWTAIDGNLPDMPVRWAVFHPTDNDKVLLATEAGVYATLNVNGGATQWMPSPGFPTVKTNMLKIRASDNTVAAATHGRGVFTAPILDVLPIRNVTLQGSLGTDGKALLNWSAVDASGVTKYRVQYGTDGITFTQIAEVNHPVQQFHHNLTAPAGYYRISAIEPNRAPVLSNTVVVKNPKLVKGIKVQVLPNPVSSSGNFIVSSSKQGDYSWTIIDMHGRVVENGKSFLNAGGSENQPLNVSRLSAGRYTIRIVQDKEVINSAFIKN